MDQTTTTDKQNYQDMPELQDLDAIISKISDMMKTGQVDLEELKMDLEDFKLKITGEETGEAGSNSAATPSDMAGMMSPLRPTRSSPPALGNQPSLMLKKKMSNRPSQYAGMA